MDGNRSNAICIKCGKQRGQHRATDLHCPIKSKSRSFHQFNATDKYEWNGKQVKKPAFEI